MSNANDSAMKFKLFCDKIENILNKSGELISLLKSVGDESSVDKINIIIDKYREEILKFENNVKSIKEKDDSEYISSTGDVFLK